MNTPDLVAATERLLIRADAASKLPVMRRADEATAIMLSLCAVASELAKKLAHLEPYADE